LRLVIDTNIIFSALIAGGKTRELIITAPVYLFVPEFF
jgi:predicted nucleic acid-binding protein